MSSLTATIYDKAAESWIRRSPVALSEYTGRPALWSCGDVDLNIADLGCGEGYCARELVKRMNQVDGIDISQGMINAANIAAARTERCLFKLVISNQRLLVPLTMTSLLVLCIQLSLLKKHD